MAPVGHAPAGATAALPGGERTLNPMASVPGLRPGFIYAYRRTGSFREAAVLHQRDFDPSVWAEAPIGEVLNGEGHGGAGAVKRTAADVIAVVAEADAGALDAIEADEVAGANRATVLKAIEKRRAALAE
jgi:hypothetical protein